MSCDITSEYDPSSYIGALARPVPVLVPRALLPSSLPTLQKKNLHTHKKIVLDNMAERSPRISTRGCQCPDVLICDDNKFEHFYYDSLLRQIITEHSALAIKPFVKLHFSGYDLINTYKRIAACGCKKPFLIISDFNMEDPTMTGINTACKLRELGYEGKIILRTCDSKQAIENLYPELKPSMLWNTIISDFMSKSELQLFKQKVTTCIAAL